MKNSQLGSRRGRRIAASFSPRLEQLESKLLLATVLGNGTAALIGGDITDPENDGQPDNDINYDAVFAASEEPGFGGGENAFNVFDNRLGPGNDKWCCGNGAFPLWVQATLDQPLILTHFTVSSANDTVGRDPRVWEIQGSNDGQNFTTIFRQDNPAASVWSSRLQVVRFDDGGIDFADQTTAYKTLRFTTFQTGLGGGAKFQVGEIEFFGTTGLAVSSSVPADGAVVGQAPPRATINFNGAYDVATVQASDLRVNGQAATGFNLVDDDTLEFILPGGLGAGQHTLTMAAGSVGSDDGLPPLLPFSSTFTVPTVPTVQNLPADAVLAFSAEIGAQVVNTGNDTPDVSIYWGDNDGGTNPNAWDEEIPLGELGVGQRVTGLGSLTQDTQYFYRARGTNLAGSTWASNTQSFRTLSLTAPSVLTLPATSVGGFAAVLNGRITATGGDVPEAWIYYGDNDGGTDANAWDSSVLIGERIDDFSTVASGLLPESQYFFRARAENGGGTTWATTTESFTTVEAPELVINEFMAKNDSTLTTRIRASVGDAFTGSQDTPDWIEIHNVSAGVADLGGLHLTDDINDKTKWTFPPGTTIPAGGYLVVYASGEDITNKALDETRRMHTSFKLGDGGEYLGLIKSDLTVMHEYAPEFPKQESDISYGLFGGEFRYFATPTAGSVNSNNFTDLVADTKFSHDRGFYDEPFQLEITTATDGATIRYTLDGTPPSLTRGTVYNGPISISGTSTVRALAFKAGFEPTNVDTNTYIFTAEIAQQSFQATVAAGFPNSWNGTSPDYGVDTDVAGPNDRFSGRYVDRFPEALTAVPTLSIVMDIDDMFGSRGIYSNPGNHDLEYPASFELIDPDDSSEFQINAGIKIQGGAFRSFGLTKKNSFRLKFKSEYGPSKLNFPFFGEDAASEFDTITLRMESNDGWQWSTGDDANKLYGRDQFGRETHIAMGHASPHGNSMHVYINGFYWGLYNPVERPDHSFGETYYGGSKDDWDVQNSGRWINGNGTAWNTMLSLARNVSGQAAGSSAQLEAWNRLQGNADDGSDDPSRDDFLDVENLIDYMIVNLYGGNSDWPHKNYYAGRLNAPDSTGFKFYMWDSEWSLNLRSNVNTNKTTVGNGVAEPYGILRNVPEFRMLFADHLHRNFFNGGALYVNPSDSAWDPEHPENNVPAARFAEWMDKIDEALVGESARWGDQHRANSPHTVDGSWRPTADGLLRSYFPQRSNVVLQQFRSIGLYSSVAAPTFNQHGGDIDPGFQLTMTAPSGTIYYTTDGTDPRLPGGALSPTAQVYRDSIVLDESAEIRSRARSGSNWSAMNEATFLGPPPTLTISELHYNPADAPPGISVDSQQFEFVEVYNYGDEAADLSGIHFDDGITFDFDTDSSATSLGAGQRLLIVKDQTAFASRYDTAGLTIAGAFDGSLRNSGESLTWRDSFGQEIDSFDYNDAWYSLTDGTGFSLTQVDASDADIDLNEKASWKPSGPLHGTPGTADTDVTPPSGSVIINEVLIHSNVGPGDWIELHNTTSAPIDIGGWYLSDDNVEPKKFRIPTGTIIAANGFLVFTEDDHFGAAAVPAPLTPFGLSELGDDALLTAGDPASGNLLGYRSERTFGAADDGVTIGNHIKSTGGDDFTALATPTFAAANSLPLVGPIVISELHYNPGEQGEEYIELANISGADVSLFDPNNPANTWSFTNGIELAFPPGAQIPAGGLAVVVPVDPATFRSDHNIPASVPVFGPYLGALDNAGENVELSRPGAPEPDDFVPMLRVDRVRYDNKLPWPLEADGLGASLVRIATDQYGNDVANWTVGFDGGTPGTTSPEVTGAFLRGSGWTEAFLNYLDDNGLGSSGFEISSGPQRLNGSWGNADQIAIAFDQNVNVQRNYLKLTGVNIPSYAFVGFEYDDQSFVATWTLSNPLRADRLLLELSEAFTNVGAGHSQQFEILPGDVDDNKVVNRTDVQQIIESLGRNVSEASFDSRADINADGRITVADLRLALGRVPSQLPDGDPSAGSGGPSVLATDAVFDRPLPPSAKLRTPSRRGRLRAVDAAVESFDSVSEVSQLHHRPARRRR